jgi:superfamily II helicase
MGNANTNNIQITIDTKYSILENLIKDFTKNIESLKRVKINSYEDFEKCECNQKILNIEMKINEELIKIRNYVLNNSSNINEYTKSNIKLKKYVFDIQEITQEYFEIVKEKTKCFI